MGGAGDAIIHAGRRLMSRGPWNKCGNLPRLESLDKLANYTI